MKHKLETHVPPRSMTEFSEPCIKGGGGGGGGGGVGEVGGGKRKHKTVAVCNNKYSTQDMPRVRQANVQN